MKKYYFVTLIIFSFFLLTITVVDADTPPAPYYPTCLFAGTVDKAININGQNTNTWIGAEKDSLVISVENASVASDLDFTNR